MRRERGAALVEHGLLISLIAIIAISSLYAVVDGINKTICVALDGLTQGDGTTSYRWDDDLKACIDPAGGAMGGGSTWFGR